MLWTPWAGLTKSCACSQAYQSQFPLLQLSLLAELSSHMLSGGEVGTQSKAALQDSAVRGSSTAAIGTGVTDSDSSQAGMLLFVAPIFTGIFCM